MHGDCRLSAPRSASTAQRVGLTRDICRLHRGSRKPTIAAPMRAVTREAREEGSSMRIRRTCRHALFILVVVLTGLALVANEALAVQWGPRRTVGSNGQGADHNLAVGGAIAHVLYDDYDAKAIEYRRSTD